MQNFPWRVTHQQQYILETKKKQKFCAEADVHSPHLFVDWPCFCDEFGELVSTVIRRHDEAVQQSSHQVVQPLVMRERVMAAVVTNHENRREKRALYSPVQQQGRPPQYRTEKIETPNK